ncbi:MAG: DNA mismatch repair protein MutS [Flavobacteriaceae bacterium]|nr:MAG: DNA mismatch repair protein MutS [Flavobacteriaceae bacterium]
MSQYKIGDRVEVLDETIRGTVIGLDGSLVCIETEDGFQINYTPSELVKTDMEDISVTNYEVAQVKKEKEIGKKRRQQPVKPKERNVPKMEVDLHIQHLVKFSKGLSNYEMLNLQLETAKRQLEFAIGKRIQKVVFIHGVGEGVLKEELYYLFRRYENVKYYDADYQKYGMGATEVYIYQKS